MARVAPREIDREAPDRRRLWPIVVAAAIAWATLGVALVVLVRDDPALPGKESQSATTSRPAAEKPARSTPPPARGVRKVAADADNRAEEPSAADPVEVPVAESPPTEVADGGSPTESLGVAEAVALNDDATRLYEAGRYDEAADAAKRALPALAGVQPSEAYASFNLGASLVALGSCESGLPLIDRSEQLQGHRPEFERVRGSCK